MADTGIVRLDPRAQEFRPRSSSSVPANPNPALPFFPPFLPPPQHQPLFDASPPFLSPLPGPHLLPPFPDSYCNFPQPAPPPPHPHAPSRAVVLSLLPCDVSEKAVRRELEVFGEVRAVEMEWVGDGVVTVHFYDLRHAKKAVREIREQHDRSVAPTDDGYSHPFTLGRFCGGRRVFGGRPVWAQFVIPVASCIPEGQNQGTIVIFNLDPSSSADELRRTFEAFGPVKELRDTPYKKHQRFVEFFDVRDASRALREMNGKEINGRSIVIEFSRPGGFSRRLLNAAAAAGPASSSFPSPVPNFATSGSYPPRSASSPPQILPEPLALQRKFSQSSDSGFFSDGIFLEGLSLEGVGADNKKTGKKKMGGSKQQQMKGKSWKGKRQVGGKVDSRFAMEEARNCSDTRTTIMIKNIPNKYRFLFLSLFLHSIAITFLIKHEVLGIVFFSNSQKLLLSMLDNHCIHTNEQIDLGGRQEPFSSYDFVYLPIDFNNKCNVGYGFVNMTTPEAAQRLYKAFHRRRWEVFNSRKICEVTYARIQGLEALRDHFKNSKFPSEMDHYLPVVFIPPREGRILTEPSPVVGRSQQPLGEDPGEEKSSDGEDELVAVGIGHSRGPSSEGGGDNNDGV